MLSNDAIYTPFTTAVATALSRRGAPAAIPGDPLAQRLAARPHAVLFRQIATPNYELRLFWRLVTATGFTPLILEYHHDKFVTRNSDKMALARLQFYDGLGRNGGARVRSAVVADVSEIDGLRLHDARTRWGESLIDLHHELLGQDPALAAIERYEASDWFGRHGGSADTYYADFFSLFSGCSILFDCFWLSGEDGRFLKQTVVPAFCEATNRGARPLLCRTYPEAYDDHPHWTRYSTELEPIVRERLHHFQSMTSAHLKVA